MQRREYVFICTVCEPMHAETLISTSALTNYANTHVHRHQLGHGTKRARVVTIVSSPVEETDSPELEGLLRWETHVRTERAGRSTEHLAQEGEGGTDP